MSRPDDNSLTAAQIAAQLGVSVGAFRNRHRRMIPDRLVVTVGRRQWFKPGAVAAIIEALLSEQQERLVDDPDLGSGDSPALERLRAARASREELKLATDRGELVPHDAAINALQPVAAAMRRAGAQIGKRYGVEAQQIIEESLDDAEHRFQQQKAEAKGGDDG